MSDFEFKKPPVPVRLVRRLLHGAILPKTMEREVCRNGIILRLTAMNPQERLLLKRGFIERVQFPRFCEGVSAFAPTAMLDVGANLGYYCLHAARLGLCENIHAVEGSPRFFKRLQRNIAANGFENRIRPIFAAVSDSSRKIRVNTPDEMLRDIQTTTLDELFDFKGERLAVKMDIEGHEESALRGAEKLLQNNEIFLQVEIWSHKVGCIRYLEGLGLRLVANTGWDFYFVSAGAGVAARAVDEFGGPDFHFVREDSARPDSERV